MLLRKYLVGARIETVVQPRWERMLELVASYRSGPQSDERVRFRLIAEMMGNLSNIIFCDEAGMILGSLKHVGAEVNRYRTVAANVRYIPPPPQQHTFTGHTLPKVEAATLQADSLALWAGDQVPVEQVAQGKKRRHAPAQTKLWQLLTRHLLGFSPLLAREAVYRTTGDAETPFEGGVGMWEELAWNVRELAALYDSHVWSPHMVERITEAPAAPGTSGAAVPVACAPYVLEQYIDQPGLRSQQSPSINVLLDDYFARSEWRDAMENVRAPLRRLLQTQLERCRRKGELLQREQARTAEAARYRLEGDLLLAHQHEVRQGLNSVILPSFFAEEASGQYEEIAIALDPRFDAVGNATRLFNKYAKLRRATALVPAQIVQNAMEMATIEQLLADLMLADTPAEVALVKAEVQGAGYIRGAAQRPAKKKAAAKSKKQLKSRAAMPGGGVPLRLQSRDGFALLIGKNSRQNEEITFHQATANDTWLHARGVPGAHVIIKAGGREIPYSTLDQAARLAAYFSQARGSTAAPVDYTLQKYVRHMKGGGPGMVIYEREKTIFVAPENIE